MKRFLWPLAIFLILVVFLGVGLTLNPREVPSPLVDKPAPSFTLARLHHPERSMSPSEMAGQVWLLNVWASWCVSCRQEHPLLVQFSKANVLPIVGLNYKDQRPDALKWLDDFGNPYSFSVMDTDGKVGIDYGVYGVPETFVIDRNGVIRYKQIGPITPDVLQNKLLPMIRKLQG
ncbi:MAG: DsbE family thiol:disulfide interchange protein [Betaproteobacteria bacterium]|nr:DsbE family thiol:disulfide interchange protein [Betaproteobacteria bacterium]